MHSDQASDYWIKVTDLFIRQQKPPEARLIAIAEERVGIIVFSISFPVLIVVGISTLTRQSSALEVRLGKVFCSNRRLPTDLLSKLCIHEKHVAEKYEPFDGRRDACEC